jgi:hypothetical protein
MSNKPDDVNLSNRIIDALGGNRYFVSQYGVSSAAVSAWRTKGLPYPWAMYLKLRYRMRLKKAGVL